MTSANLSASAERVLKIPFVSLDGSLVPTIVQKSEVTIIFRWETFLTNNRENNIFYGVDLGHL